MGADPGADVSEGGTYIPPDGGGETFFPSDYSNTGYTPAQLASMGYAPAGPGNPAATNLAAQLATMWTKIAGQAISPQTVITGPGGTSITTPAGQTANVSPFANIFGQSMGGGSGVSILPLVVIAGLGLFAFKALSK